MPVRTRTGDRGVQGARLVEIQRARLIAGAVGAIEELGYARTTVGRITARACVSRRTFYEQFANREECLMAVLEDAVGLVGVELAAADLEDLPWRERVRTGLAGILAFFDREPALARVCVVQALRGGPRVLERREEILAGLAAAIDEGRAEGARGGECTRLTAEGLVGAAFAIVYARLLRGEHGPLTGLLGELMGMIVLPYLGPTAARREHTRPAPVSLPGTSGGSAKAASGAGDLLEGVRMRLTYRTARVLDGIAEYPGASNRMVADYAGIADPGQTSKLLARLERVGLLANTGKGHAKGEPNAWKLTVRGEQIARSIRAEVPEALMPVQPVAASTAVLRGVLNPGKEGEPGAFELDTYEFVYRESKTECKGAGEVATPAGLSLGAGKEAVSQGISGLAAGTEYTVCLVVHNEAQTETAVSVPVVFRTARPPEVPGKLEAKPVAATTATLNGVLNPSKEGDPGSYAFFYRQSAGECEGEGQKTTTATSSLGGKEEAAQAPVSELLPHTRYTFCLRAKNEAGEEVVSAPITFTTLAAAPKIEEPSVTDVASTSATFSATVDPGGAATTYAFEYAPAGGSFAPVPEPEGSGSIPEGITGVPLSVHVQQGLAPNTSYAFRLVASNSAEHVTGESVSFTTQRTGGALALPDNRQWEMVTPPNKLGALFFAYQRQGTSMILQASVHGDAIVDQASQPSEPDPPGYANEVQVLSTRGPGGWSSQSLDVPHAEAAGPDIFVHQDYRLFSSDLSLGVVDPWGNFTALSPQASESTPYLRTDYLNGNVAERCESSYLSSSSCFRPLVSGCPAAPAACAPSVEEHADVPRGSEFGEERGGRCVVTQYCGPNFVDASPDLSHVVLRSPAQLTSTSGGSGYYEWSDGQLQSLPMPLVTGGGNREELAMGLHAISVNGQRVVLQSNEEVNRHLYLRDTNLPSSNDPNAQTNIEIGVGIFDTASADDSRVFFSGYLSGYLSGDLFEYDLNAEVGHRLTDLTEGAGVSQVLGASEDGSYVYFTSPGVLTPSAHSTSCSRFGREQEAATCNLYMRHDGVTLIAPSGTIAHEAQVSPDGHWLAFMSDKDLTGYNTRDAVSGLLDEEVYLYDVDAGRLVCASCDPTGARPVALTQRFEEEYMGLADTFYEREGGVSAGVPQWHNFGPVEYQARYLSDSGRLFFDSFSALVPQDINGTEDVYEYEPTGLQNQEGKQECTPSSATFSERSDGCISLISSGTSAQPSAFLDASENGSDVFFATTSKLALQDYDSAPDVYDAHECTSVSPCPPAPVAEPPPCVTEASCKPAPTPQPSIFGASGSATFSGPGNIVPTGGGLSPAAKPKAKLVKCKKGSVKKKDRCVKTKKSMKSRKAKRASDDRRTM